jgi:predicted nucleotidyltransferase
MPTLIVVALMSQYSWANCPDTIRTQTNAVVSDLAEILGTSLIGVYLHGSLAMGCFNPALSDMDLLVVSTSPMPLEVKRRVTEALLRYSGAPQAIELSILAESQLYPWEHPTAYDFHFSESHRARRVGDLETEKWREWNSQSTWDSDLAAHITVAQLRGICLYGEPISLVLPLVPASDYADSIVTDLWWARARAEEDPAGKGTYFVLNACRVYAYLLDGYITSKDEAAVWALSILPEEHRPLVVRALEIYRGVRPAGEFNPTGLDAFIQYIHDQVKVFVN